jgi:glycosyltransferase involved in cell wall biosynthesis
MMTYGGAETVLTKLAACLTKKGFENAILTLSMPPDFILESHQELNWIVPTQTYAYKVRAIRFFDALGLMNEIITLRRYVHEFMDNFDLVNVHNFPATWSLFPSKKACVWMCNEPPDLWSNPNPSPQLKMLRDAGLVLDKFIVNSSIDAICVADEFNANRAIKRYKKQPTIVYYGIDHDLFSGGKGERFTEKYGLHDSFVLLQVGWIGPPKNQLESVRAVEKVRRVIPNVKLVLAGSSVKPYEEMLKEYIRRTSCEKHIIFTGYLPNYKVRDLYHASDIVLSPVKLQGGWLAPFEALCASRPIIVAPSMSASSIIKREKIGVVTDNFAQAILDVYNNPKPYQDMAKRGKQWVAENLSWDKFCDRMLSVFEKVLHVT